MVCWPGGLITGGRREDGARIPACGGRLPPLEGEAPTGRGARLGQRDILRADAPVPAVSNEARTAHPPQLAIAPALTTGARLATTAQRTDRHTPVMILAAVQTITTDRHRGEC